MSVEDHKWFDPACNASGCRSLLLEGALKKLAFLAMTTGGTAGPDQALQEAIAEATGLIEYRVEPSALDELRKPVDEVRE